MSKFAPTHKITSFGHTVLVSLCSDIDGGGGPAYTEQEWETQDAAAYERSADGHWTFQGNPFAGSVERYTDPLMTPRVLSYIARQHAVQASADADALARGDLMGAPLAQCEPTAEEAADVAAWRAAEAARYNAENIG